jgi:type III secretion system low calcium response chaperone LcrH/SycD
MSASLEKTIEEAVQVAFDSIDSGTSLAQQGTISAQEVEGLYALGFNYYAQKDFVKAEEIFSYALPFDFLHKGIVNGLAAARKMQGKYEEALKAYALAGLIDMDNPEHSFYAAECFFALDQMPACAQALDGALGLIDDEEQYKDLSKKIHRMKNNLKEQSYE